MDTCDARATPDPCDFARPQTIDDLKEMAPKLNPIVGYCEPPNLYACHLERAALRFTKSLCTGRR